MARDLIYNLNNSITIKAYSNGSYAYLTSKGIYLNMPKELAEVLISKYIL
jgi:hypothetical protein